MKGKVKYNFTIILLIVVIGVFLGVTPSLSILSSPIDSSTGTTGEEIVDKDQDEMPTKGFVRPSSTASVFSRINFGFKVLKTGEGFSSETTQSVVAMGLVQNIFSRSLRSGELDYVEEWQYTNSTFAKNGFLSKYSDGTIYKENIINNKSKFSGEKKTYEQGYADKRFETSAGDYFSKVGNFNDFPFIINSSNSTARYDKVKSEIKVSFRPEEVSQEYIQAFKDNGTGSVTFKEISIVFKINKQTGFFTSIVKNEKFSTVYAGIPVNCDAKMTINFLKVNTSMKTEIESKAAQNFK